MKEDLQLGTTEAAVRSCVSVIAAVTAQREDVLAYWLDLYYQVRRAYEIDQKNEADPQLIRREDLYPVLRELMKDALKSTAKEEAKKRVEKKPAKKTPADPQRCTQEAGPEEDAEETQKVSGWARKKVLIRDRLLQARADGVTIAELEQAGGVFSREILGILEGAKIEMKSYRRVEAALDALGR